MLCTACFAMPAFSDDQREAGDISVHTTDSGARIIFKWNSQSKTSFTPEVRGNKVLLHFEEPVKLQWSRAINQLKPYIKEVETLDDSQTVVLTLKDPANARKFLLYGRNGIDFTRNGLELSGMPRVKNPTELAANLSDQQQEEPEYEPAAAPKKPKAPKPPKRQLATAKPAKPVSVADTTDLTKLAPAAGEPTPEVTAVVAPPEPAATIAVPAATPSAAAALPVAPAPVAAPIAAPLPVVTPLPVVSAPATATPSEAAAPQAITPAPVVAPATPVTPLPAVTATAPAATIPAPAAEAPREQAATPAPTEAKPAGEEPAPVAETEKPKESPKGEIISLPLLADDSLAVFIRNKTLWIAADENAHMTEESFKNENKSFSHPLSSIPAKNGSVLTVALDKDTNVQVNKLADGKLQLELKPDAEKPAQSFLPSLSTQDAKTSLSIEATKPAKAIAVTDPTTGDLLTIIPVPTAGEGVDPARSFVEFSLPPTAQGIVVQQVADGLDVKSAKASVEITAPKGLVVSPELKQQLEEAKAEPNASKVPPVFFPYARWKLDDEKKFVPTQLKLIHASLADNPEDANNARLRLLGLYLSEGLFAEANGMANEILRNSYKFYVDHKVAAMRGAANFFRYRLSEAERDFSSPELAGLPETDMWLALCAELTNKNNSVFKFKENYNSIIKYYPPVFIQKMAIIAADKNIARKDYDAATNMFTTLQKENIDEPVKKYIDFMRAKILSETGNEDEAAKIWERQSADVGDRLIRARAEFSLVNMYLKEEKIPIEDATKRLEKLRIVWRGDGLELNVLSLLGSLYVEQKDYTRALRAWRDIVAYYPDVPDAITTARKMEEVFVKLYNKGGADDLPPLSALSLFYEFRDLVPTGSEGDLMIRNLAERLVKIDLLDRASQLLNHQIRNRLEGTERSRVGARLAEIYLMNRQPKQALETLKTTGYGDLTPEIQLQRIRLTAQALAQQGQLDKAIDVLSSDTSADGNLLRLTVYWTNWDWPNVVAMAEEILSNRNDPSAALTLQESEVLLKLATAYVYEHDSGQIQYLRDYFTPLLKNNPNKNSFLFITSESGSIDYTNLSNLDIDIKTVKGFINNSRKNAASKTTPAAPVAAAAPEIKKAVN